MSYRHCILTAAGLLASLSAVCPTRIVAAEPLLQLQPEDHICFIGNTLADRMQHHAWLETMLHAMHPEHDLTCRNLGFAGDEIQLRPRSANFGSPDEWLTKVGADVVFCFFGYNEALRGAAKLAQFKYDLAAMIDGMLAQKYNGHSPPRLVLFSPLAHENLHSPHLPDGRENNQKLELYTQAIKEVCAARQIAFVDLFAPTRDLYRQADTPLTMNGIHLLEHGNRALAEIIVRVLFPRSVESRWHETELRRLREAVLDKNLYWFSRYRVVDGYNVFGGRSKLAFHGQSNYDVLQREMEIFDVMTANRDRRVWAVARGGDLEVTDDNIPSLLEVKTNRPGELPGGQHAYLGGEEAIAQMQVAEGMRVNLFASEEMFPEIVNPVQMAVDTDSRLFVSVWPSYPHWNPTEPRTDRIVCLPDENGDGVADKCIVFADELNSITGFEFWGGGMLVSAPPELWFLKDSDGDDRADVRIRVLQGLSSADTHHTANAFVVGPDGGLYWSRGVFHVTNMETPTRTFRSTTSGVYRFDPRTYEIEFHFPIGPNPHGDVFDQWGYQFVNDGTGGTGCYVNIGKGVGNKQWFRKRVRPVPATGILSSSHFPERNNGNFLICNAIGFLGVLQHEVKYNGADITAEEIEPILVSSDPNFRPTDLEIGGDGALYVSDWCNALIGHMQHNIRDPNRDHAHGRIYRVTCPDRPLLKSVKMKGQPVEQVLQAFLAKENGIRYRARLELSGRPTAVVTDAVQRWANRLDPGKADEAQALLECLWVFEEHRVPNLELLRKVFLGASDGRVRAAAIRTLGHWGAAAGDWQPTLFAAARDESALVRAEAVKASVAFQGLAAAEVVFQVAALPTDVELDTVLKYARDQIKVDRLVTDAVQQGQQLSPAAQAYVLKHASVADLVKLPRTEEVCRAILGRPETSLEQLADALNCLAELSQKDQVDVLVDLIDGRKPLEAAGNLVGLGKLLMRQSTAKLNRVRARLEQLVAGAPSAEIRQIGYAAWTVADGAADNALNHAQQSPDSLDEFLRGIVHIPPDRVPDTLYARVRPLLFELPVHLQSGDADTRVQGMQLEYFHPHPQNVALETLAGLRPRRAGIVTEFTLDSPLLERRDDFALRFTGVIHIDQAGEYTFFTNSDDGSRLYIGKELLVDNDGDHGMAEKSGTINLSAGHHPICVTYYDQGGSEGLVISWAGPGISKSPVPRSALTVAGVDTLQDVAIRALAAIPGRAGDVSRDLAQLIQSGHHRGSAVQALLEIPAEHWPREEIRPLAETLAAYVSEIPARYRTGNVALAAMRLTDKLASMLPKDQAALFQSRLAELRINVIRIATVPHRMIYDKERIAVQAGSSVEFVFTNPDSMPHNFSIVEPGALEEVGLLGEATAREPDAMARHYVPNSDKILLSSRLLQPGETQALSFDVPRTPGIYPYVCTYPGHWRRMYGALYVVEDLKQYHVNRDAYLANHPLPLRDELMKYNERNTEWTFDELSPFIESLLASHHQAGHAHEARNFDVGKNIFKVANCVACHRLHGVGYEFGPDLTKLDAKKKTPEHILRSILEPSKDVDEKYQSYIFELDTGKNITGLILEETPETVKVIVDPIAKPEPLVLNKSMIEDDHKSQVSAMPVGLANRLSREEILDLVAYVYAAGDQQHRLFQAHGHGHD